MKLQISFDLTNLDEALAIAQQVDPFADILEIGTILLYKEGIRALDAFRSAFPNKQLFVDAKLADRAEEVMSLCCQGGANIISVLAGTSNATITKATQIARERGCQIALDLIDANSMSQSSRDAEGLGVHTVLFHRAHEEASAETLIEEWATVRGNTKLPIFVSGRIKRSNITSLLKLKPQGFIIGRAITQAQNPAQEAEYFYTLIREGQ